MQREPSSRSSLQPALADLANRLDERYGPSIWNPWTMIGKGPTFDLARFGERRNILALNDAMAYPCEIGHAIDFDVFDRIEPACEFLLVPQSMKRLRSDGGTDHIRISVEWNSDRVRDTGMPHLPHPTLERFHEEKRLFVYDRSILKPGTPHFFSSIPALSILGELGIRKVFTAGILDGPGYAKEFAHLTPGGNGRSFEEQREGLEAVCKFWGIELIPLVGKVPTP